MRAITVYEATDGTRWDSNTDCITRDTIDAAVRDIEATIPRVPARGRVVADIAAMQAAKIRTVQLCRELWPNEAVFKHPPLEIHPQSYAGRFLSEVGGPLNRLWFVFSCWDGKWVYEQPYYAAHPSEFKEARA